MTAASFELRVLPERQRTTEWPRDTLDVAALERSGWRPTAFRQFVLKVHGRCNLACDYCYVYNGADGSWKTKPARMSDDTVAAVAHRIGEHAEAHGLARVGVVLHGGEPLLAGGPFIASVARQLRAAAPAGVEVDVHLQTNATLLDEAILDRLLEHRIRVSVSIDGDPAVHDAHRVHTDGRGSYGEVEAALRLLQKPRFRELFAGLLCVVDVQSDPVATYEHLRRYEPPTIDLLLPHANWTAPPPPPGPGGRTHGGWLIEVFDRWFGSPDPEPTVRLFEEIIRGVLGRPSRIESIGTSPAGLVVVETDGAIEQTDALKSAYDGAAATGLDVHRHAFDAALRLPEVAARQIGEAALAPTCQRCDLRAVCGGGYYPHRYEQGSGFRHPSVFCDDLTRLIRHVHARVAAGIAPLRAQTVR